jgi:hypothetical protein
MCLLRGTDWIFTHIAGEIWSVDRAMVQEGSCWSLTAEARVRPEVSPHDICGRQSGSVTVFSPNTSVSPCQYHSANAPY